MLIKRSVVKPLLIPLTAVTAGSFLVSYRLFKYAFERVDHVPPTSKEKQKYADDYYDYVAWMKQTASQTWTLNANSPENKVVASYIPATRPTKKTVIIAHGYKGNRETMANYVKMFHEMGFNALVPDDRGHGESSGNYINFGWLDRLDYLQWINRVIDHVGKDSDILLFGVSMGGATVEMISGETLPPQVKALIADCGYASIREELTYLLKQQFHLPEYPVEPLVSGINRHVLGFSLDDVSSTKQLAKNNRPILFIHGGRDTYVPVKMAYENYRATKSPKQLWIVKNATHAESFWYNPTAYRKRVTAFLETYFK
ncbi:hydrolase [Lentilactobacillus farraginis DSM 18382 = JCM 14108]|uniref:Hydrolase n=1 Tax=Lentilactobacillus farraginis DSM 18382 = JCM 14108 TaxID=1423743 RepID=X0PIF0_9LACO|nr:hydrolase [Lentilactobacillus farraginis DSM 18382 = JCM 14108]